jgi:hypothetical protein
MTRVFAPGGVKGDDHDPIVAATAAPAGALAATAGRTFAPASAAAAIPAKVQDVLFIPISPTLARSPQERV